MHHTHTKLSFSVTAGFARDDAQRRTLVAMKGAVDSLVVDTKLDKAEGIRQLPELAPLEPYTKAHILDSGDGLTPEELVTLGSSTPLQMTKLLRAKDAKIRTLAHEKDRALLELAAAQKAAAASQGELQDIRQKNQALTAEKQALAAEAAKRRELANQLAVNPVVADPGMVRVGARVRVWRVHECTPLLSAAAHVAFPHGSERLCIVLICSVAAVPRLRRGRDCFHLQRLPEVRQGTLTVL